MSFVIHPKGRLRPLSKASSDLTELRDRLQDLNSAFPETKRFLTGRGLEHVSQLDPQGLADLREYLRGVYKRSVH